MKWDDFKRWFNKDFWRAFKARSLPIRVPSTPKDREQTVRRVFDAVVSARYAASIPEAEIIMNKGYGIARSIPAFCIEDYIVFYFCIKELEDVLCFNRTDNTFGGWTLGGKIRKKEDEDVDFDTGYSGARYSFDPRAWRAAFGEFNSLLFSQLDTGQYRYVLQFDLSNFYDSVRLDILERWIREDADASKGWIIALLFYFLNQWNRKNTGLHPQGVGIPQDALADCSRILGNFYLQKYDRFAHRLCNQADTLYFRYSDDQMILLKDTKPVERLLLLLTRNLDRYGLRVNQKKVYLWKKKELERNRCRSIQEIFSIKGDNQKKIRVRRFAEAYLSMSEKELKNSWNSGYPLLNRLLFAKLEALPKKTFQKVVSRYTSEDYLARADVEKLLRVDSLNSMLKKPINLAKKLRQMGDKYDHNAFHYEVLSYAKVRKKKVLVAHFTNRLQELEVLMKQNILS